jgi:CBS domain containing-hemolysin-like protein
LSELKRHARDGSKTAKRVYEVRAVHPNHIIMLLWIKIGLLLALTVLLLGVSLWEPVVVVITMFVVLLLFGVLPKTQYPAQSLSMASLSTPVAKKLLILAKPGLIILEKAVARWTSIDQNRQLHSKAELLEVLRGTQIEGTPFSKDELNIAVHALTFGDIKITEIMTPRSVVKSVRAGDVLSPVLLGELHDSGYSRFPVTESERGSFVGVLYSKDLSDLRANRSVQDVMRPELYYVNEFTSLDNVLNAFLRTQHHLFLVVNEFEEVVGIITIEDVLEQIIGRKIIDEFDQYADLRAVAKQIAVDSAKLRHGETV